MHLVVGVDYRGVGDRVDIQAKRKRDAVADVGSAAKTAASTSTVEIGSYGASTKADDGRGCEMKR